MSPRTGRPTDDPKTIRVGIRMSKVDEEKLEYCCKVLGLTKTEVIQRGIEKVYEEARK